MENIKKIISLLINNKVAGIIKTDLYQIQYFPQLDIFFYITPDREYVVNEVKYPTLHEAREAGEKLGIDPKNTPYWIFQYYPDCIKPFMVIDRLNDKVLFDARFTQKGNLVFDKYDWEYTKILKKELRAYHKKGIFVSL